MSFARRTVRGPRGPWPAQGQFRLVDVTPAGAAPVAPGTLVPALVGVFSVVAGGLLGLAVPSSVKRRCGGGGRSRCGCGCRRSAPTRPTDTSTPILGALRHAVVAVMPDGIILDANGAALRLLGYSAVRTLSRARAGWRAGAGAVRTMTRGSSRLTNGMCRLTHTR